jgi:hypothetical protein
VKPAEILFILGTQLDYKMLSRFHVCDWSKSFKEGQTEVENMSHEMVENICESSEC